MAKKAFKKMEENWGKTPRESINTVFKAQFSQYSECAQLPMNVNDQKGDKKKEAMERQECVLM
jgi:hypothetical protein